jgi:ribonuclease PH
MRQDMRAPDQLRPVRIEPNYLPTAEGSALIAAGHTRVLCAVSIEPGVPGFLKGRGQGWLTAEYAMLPRATLTRTPRESSKGRIGGRTHEIQRLIGRSLRSILDSEALGERTLLVDCDVIQADGGTRTAAITGACVALHLALHAMVSSGALPRRPLRGLLAAVSVGLMDGQPLLDLNYAEDSRAEVDMNVVLTDAGEFVEFQATAERRPFAEATWRQMLDLARTGIAQLLAEQRRALREAGVEV